jgi:signal transduction histidine kinase
LCEDPQGGFLIGTSESTLVRFENGHFSVFPQRVGRGLVTALACQTNGNLWVGSSGGGLKRLRWGSDQIVSVSDGLLSPSIRTLYLDSQDTLWIGTAGGGLSRWQKDRVVTFTSQQGLGAANTVSQIVEDDHGNLWLGCNRGVVCVSKEELEAMAQGRIAFLHPRTYGINDGMPAEECSGGFSPAGFKTRSGLIGFSTVSGLVVLDPRNQETNAPPPAAVLEEVLINGKLQRLPLDPTSVADDEFDTPILPPLVIPPGAREVELHYTGISFASPEKINFRYQLEGLDPDWVEAGSRRAAYYQRIPPGDFVFRVAACSANGEWNPQAASLTISVRPFLWQTAWFRWGMGLASLGAVAGTLRQVERRKYRRRLAALETQHAIERERLRISKDMHDHIGGMLTQVSQLSDLGHAVAGEHSAAQGHFDRIGAQARGAVQALDEIIWATNPRNDNLPRFAEYVSRFADEFFENTSMRCWQEIPTELPPVPLRSDLRHNVFLALREALNNALKHSGASELWLRLAVTESQVSLEVEDNGCGFDPAQTQRMAGNGLENMKTRLAESGGRMELSSSPGRGARIRFVFPLDGSGGPPRF